MESPSNNNLSVSDSTGKLYNDSTKTSSLSRKPSANDVATSAQSERPPVDQQNYHGVHIKAEPLRTFHEWDAHLDEETGNEFFYNRRTKESTWSAPFEELLNPKLAAYLLLAKLMYNPYDESQPHPLSCCGDWSLYIDENSLNLYYCNDETGESTWNTPTEWDEHKVMVPPLAVLSGNMEGEWTSLLDSVEAVDSKPNENEDATTFDRTYVSTQQEAEETNESKFCIEPTKTSGTGTRASQNKTETASQEKANSHGSRIPKVGQTTDDLPNDLGNVGHQPDDVRNPGIVQEENLEQKMDDALWFVYRDFETLYQYFTNAETQETVWEPPRSIACLVIDHEFAPIQPGKWQDYVHDYEEHDNSYVARVQNWEIYEDVVTGKWYYHDSTTGNTTWTVPDIVKNADAADFEAGNIDENHGRQSTKDDFEEQNPREKSFEHNHDHADKHKADGSMKEGLNHVNDAEESSIHDSKRIAQVQSQEFGESNTAPKEGMAITKEDADEMNSTTTEEKVKLMKPGPHSNGMDPEETPAGEQIHIGTSTVASEERSGELTDRIANENGEMTATTFVTTSPTMTGSAPYVSPSSSEETSCSQTPSKASPVASTSLIPSVYTYPSVGSTNIVVTSEAISTVPSTKDKSSPELQTDDTQDANPMEKGENSRTNTLQSQATISIHGHPSKPSTYPSFPEGVNQTTRQASKQQGASPSMQWTQKEQNTEPGKKSSNFTLKVQKSFTQERPPDASMGSTRNEISIEPHKASPKRKLKGINFFEESTTKAFGESYLANALATVHKSSEEETENVITKSSTETQNDEGPANVAKKNTEVTKPVAVPYTIDYPEAPQKPLPNEGASFFGFGALTGVVRTKKYKNKPLPPEMSGGQPSKEVDSGNSENFPGDKEKEEIEAKLKENIAKAKEVKEQEEAERAELDAKELDGDANDKLNTLRTLSGICGISTKEMAKALERFKSSGNNSVGVLRWVQAHIKKIKSQIQAIDVAMTNPEQNEYETTEYQAEKKEQKDMLNKSLEQLVEWEQKEKERRQAMKKEMNLQLEQMRKEKQETLEHRKQQISKEKQRNAEQLKQKKLETKMKAKQSGEAERKLVEEKMKQKKAEEKAALEKKRELIRARKKAGK